MKTAEVKRPVFYEKLLSSMRKSTISRIGKDISVLVRVFM